MKKTIDRVVLLIGVVTCVASALMFVRDSISPHMTASADITECIWTLGCGFDGMTIAFTGAPMSGNGVGCCYPGAIATCCEGECNYALGSCIDTCNNAECNDLPENCDGIVAACIDDCWDGYNDCLWGSNGCLPALDTLCRSANPWNALCDEWPFYGNGSCWHP